MPFDYSQLYVSEDGVTGTWREHYDKSLTYAENIKKLLENLVYLPHDFYDIVAAYAIIPSALCKIVPYLFLYGQSGSGKSSVAKLICAIHGIEPSSPTDTFAAMRNIIHKRRYGYVELPMGDDDPRTWNKQVEVNFHFVWEDIDQRVFAQNPDLYRLFKIGYDRKTDKIAISGKEPGTIEEFHCFSPKTFSSISPLHLDDSYRELKRRLIVIPFKKVEELSPERIQELNIDLANYHAKLIDFDSIDWTGFKREFEEFWDLETAQMFIAYRQEFGRSVRGLSSQQRVISLDLMACGCASGIWSDEHIALERIKAYWQWFKQETEQSAGLGQLLKEYLKDHEKNAKVIQTEPKLSVTQLRSQIDTWFNQGWLLERPRTSSIKELMLDLGWKVNKGIWSK